MKRIGIMGGTFNPIHNGHLHLARTAQKKFKLAKVIFVPSGLPPHKGREELADKEHRYQMTYLATEGNPRFSVSRIELDRKGYSYAVDTFKVLRKEFGKAELYYIMGLDSINEILSWKKPLELLKLCQFIVATRPGAKVRTFKRISKFPPLVPDLDKVHLIELKADVSSTEVRRRIKEGKSIRRLVPKAIAEYIEKYRLYT